MGKKSRSMIFAGKAKTSIIEYPTGRYGFVGSVPMELCRHEKNALHQDIYPSKVYETREEAEKALAEYNERS